MRRKYIFLAILTAALAALIYAVPAIEDILIMAAAGALCIVIMAISVFAGGLTDAEDR